MALVIGEKIELSDIPSSETLNILKTQYYHIPDNCSVGDTVILDGIECLCIATGVTIQGSSLTRIAVDKNHDLGYYQKYVRMTQNGIVNKYIHSWRWGGYETALGNTSVEVGYGLQNTINCLANPVNYTKGTYTGTSGDGHPWLWTGVNDFRSAHSDKWFVPSLNELLNYIYPNKSSLTFDTTTGGSSADYYWSSSERSASKSYLASFDDGSSTYVFKCDYRDVRLCRAF